MSDTVNNKESVTNERRKKDNTYILKKMKEKVDR